jgi:hypothetical protein
MISGASTVLPGDCRARHNRMTLSGSSKNKKDCAMLYAHLFWASAVATQYNSPRHPCQPPVADSSSSAASSEFSASSAAGSHRTMVWTTKQMRQCVKGSSIARTNWGTLKKSRNHQSSHWLDFSPFVNCNAVLQI